MDYAYAGDDVRVGATVGSTSTPYLWDREAGLPLLVDDGTSAYLHDEFGLLAVLDGSGSAYHLSDALGSVRGLADDAGTLSGTADYSVFGEVRGQAGASSHFGFTGEWADATTGFTHLRARDLNAALGRFLSVDTVQPNAPGTQGFNVYAYVANNPTTWIDPSGHLVELARPPVPLMMRLAKFLCPRVGWCVIVMFVMIAIYVAALCLRGDLSICAPLLDNTPPLEMPPPLSLPNLKNIHENLPRMPTVPRLPSWLPWVGGAAAAGTLMAGTVPTSMEEWKSAIEDFTGSRVTNSKKRVFHAQGDAIETFDKIVQSWGKGETTLPDWDGTVWELLDGTIVGLRIGHVKDTPTIEVIPAGGKKQFKFKFDGN